MTIVHDRFFVWGLALGLTYFFASCNNRTDVLNEKLYDGPMVSMDSIYTKMSDSAKIKVTLKAPKQNNLKSGDREWPKGLFLEYLDDDGSVLSTFKADYVYYTSKEKVYRSEGNVVVRNLDTGDELNTEELFWSPTDEEFYTDRFVTIQSGDELHKGEGLRADQDFTSYKILKPQGVMYLDEL